LPSSAFLWQGLDERSAGVFRNAAGMIKQPHAFFLKNMFLVSQAVAQKTKQDTKCRGD